jgi:hypothetical protein
MSIKKLIRKTIRSIKKRLQQESLANPQPVPVPETPAAPNPGTNPTLSGRIETEWLSPTEPGFAFGCTWEWFSPTSFSNTRRTWWTDRIRARKGNSLFLCLSHVGCSITPYKSGWSGEFDENKLAWWAAELKRLNGLGIWPIVGLYDDTQGHNWHNPANSECKRFISKVVPMLNPFVAQWCVGMEPEEYWSVAHTNHVASLIRAAGATKPIGSHTTKPEYASGSAIDILHWEPWHPRDGINKSDAEIVNCINRAKTCGKPVLFWEWSWHSDPPHRARIQQQARVALAQGVTGIGSVTLI